MSNNLRKLLPYEHQLVETLGITKEQYLEFVLLQQEYTDIKAGTVLDVRNWEVVAIVLTIVGVLFQVASALLMPKPQIPSITPQGQRQQTRDDIFAPRFGFNTVQNLAKYGDPINLIYTNTAANANGGVRVATSLLWSSVKSFGSSQYVQMLLLLGAGGIGAIDANRTAFGQTPIRNLIAQNYWLYFRPNNTGIIRGSDLAYGGNGESDPAAAGVGSRNLYRISPSSSTSAGDGFSHALSPATSNQFGLYSPVPINADIIIRNEAGAEETVFSGIQAAITSPNGAALWGSNLPSSTLRSVPVGSILTVTLSATNQQGLSTVALEAADQRRALSSAFDNAAIFKLGSAKFSVLSANRGSTEDGDVIVTLRCIEQGLAPSVAYNISNAKQDARQIAESDPTYVSLRNTANSLLNADQRSDISTAQALLNAGNIFVYQQFRTLSYMRGGAFYSTSTRLAFQRNLTEGEKQALRDFITYEDDIARGIRSDDVFFTKVLSKVEKASYETISPCHIVDLAIKARSFRRISGRQEVYGSSRVAGYPISDNGIKLRTAMFLVKYKRSTDAGFSYVKGIFVVRRAADNDNFVYLRFNSGQSGLGNSFNWHFEIEAVQDTIAEFRQSLLNEGNAYRFFYLENSGNGSTISLEQGRTLSFTGSVVNSTNFLPPLNNSPIQTNEWDLFNNTADTQYQFSFDNGPEFTLGAVSEQIVEQFDNFPGLYQDASLVGFNLYSGKNVQDLRSLSMFVTQGRQSRLLRTSGTINGVLWGQPNFEYLSPVPNGFANTAPDIFVDTVLDYNDGIGKYAGDLFSVDLEQLSRSKKFCEVNGLFMDGVIAEPSSWREFWSVHSTFSLLELAKRDGRETLLPAVPYDANTGAISRQVPISALFNQGNILEDSYKEEFLDYGSGTEDIVATIIFRQNERDGVFPKNNSVDVHLSDTNADLAIRETIDLSSFVTRREQAILVGKFLCQTKRHSRRALEFKTFPTDSFVAPGSYIYVELAQNQWNGIQTGSIGPGGALDLPLAGSIANGSYQFLLYNPNATISGTTAFSSVNVSSNTASALAGYEGYIFVLGTEIKNKRVFKVTEVAMDEEGEVTVRAVEHAVDENGLSLISKGLATRVAGLFTIDGRPE